ncbi:hypothetical protein BDW59DRAFT_164942 [Aspergillus cavernicola]|uniref:Carrier domain-containing protein n=1 Tax=Aspergillus cavernicola TaxID=176166 RepID=A0ABR4HW41_9EURO
MVTGLQVPQPADSPLLRDARFAALYLQERGQQTQTLSDSKDVQAIFVLLRSKVEPAAALEFTVDVLNRYLKTSLRLPEALDAARPLSTYGIDSLAVVEFRNWLRNELDVELSMLEIINAPSLVSICQTGFAVYRCSYKDDSQWQRMLSLIETQVRESLRCEQWLDLLPCHRLTILDDVKFNGATSHEIRDHFQAWVDGELATALKNPVKNPSQQSDKSLFTPSLASRYNFRLFVDDIRLESMDKMTFPVVKNLSRLYGSREAGDRNYKVQPEYEDGETDEGDEQVGWMYNGSA